VRLPGTSDETSNEALARYRVERPDVPEHAWFIVVGTGIFTSAVDAAAFDTVAEAVAAMQIALLE
jgi:hypothetical protein